MERAFEPGIARLREAEPARDAIVAIPSFEFDRPPPEREWMVERCFTRGTVAMLSGDGGIGKTLLMLQLLTAAVLGRPWLGMRCAPGRGLLFSCEDDHDELLRRQADIFRHVDACYGDTEGGLHLIDRVGQRDNTLAALERKDWRMRPTALLTALTRHCLNYGCSYIVIDTATQVFSGNQNDERQVVDFINMMRRLAVAVQGVVILTKHPSLSGRANGSGESGNTAWNNSVRSRLYMQQTADGTVLRGMKSNYGRKLDKIRLRWERGVFVSEEPPPLGSGTRNWYESEAAE